MTLDATQKPVGDDLWGFEWLADTAIKKASDVLQTLENVPCGRGAPISRCVKLKV